MIAVLFLMATDASCSTLEIDLQNGQKTYQFLLEGQTSTKDVGYFAYALESKCWNEAYAGFTYSPTTWSQIALGYGQEQMPDPTRFGGWIWLGKGKVSCLYLFEDGGSGPWHKTVIQYQATPVVSLGVVSLMNQKLAPMAEIKLNKQTSLKLTGYQKPEFALKIAF